MSSKKLQNILKKKYQKEHFFQEEYQVHFTTGKVIYVDVEVEYGVNEKNNHQKAGLIASSLHPDLEILKIYYC
jgi:hypothetical protein